MRWSFNQVVLIIYLSTNVFCETFSYSPLISLLSREDVNQDVPQQHFLLKRGVTSNLKAGIRNIANGVKNALKGKTSNSYERLRSGSSSNGSSRSGGNSHGSSRSGESSHGNSRNGRIDDLFFAVRGKDGIVRETSPQHFRQVHEQELAKQRKEEIARGQAANKKHQEWLSQQKPQTKTFVDIQLPFHKGKVYANEHGRLVDEDSRPIHHWTGRDTGFAVGKPGNARPLYDTPTGDKSPHPIADQFKF